MTDVPAKVDAVRLAVARLSGEDPGSLTWREVSGFVAPCWVLEFGCLDCGERASVDWGWVADFGPWMLAGDRDGYSTHSSANPDALALVICAP